MSDDFNSKNWVWVPDDTNLFSKGYVTDYLADGTCKVTVVNGTQETPQVFKETEIENCNPAKFNKCDDMALLTHLNEPSVVYNLYLRYNDDLIYTYLGLFLVAINPYKLLPIYDTKVLNLYHDDDYDKPPPHIYATTEKTFRNLVANRKDQLILVTGELGAGKTENTKRIIQYLSLITPLKNPTKGHSKRNSAYSQTIDTKILQANPILELFGNAKTIKNNNSLRFGKFIKIYFNKRGFITSANIDYYLLEKLRVVSQLPNERNYHIFYQLLKGHSDLALLGLAKDPKKHAYLRDSLVDIPNVDDAKEFNMLCAAFSIMGITDAELQLIFAVLAVVLHLGNLEFTLEKAEQATFSSTLPVDAVVKGLGINRDEFVANMVRPKVKAGREFIAKLKKPAEVRFAIDALAKHLYERLFNFFINKINANLQEDASDGPDGCNFIGVLDIAGFEIFDVNLFEQLCTNYTNEKLQQFFNHHSFILEQSEYLREDIQWEFIDFGQDLQPTIDLIETRNPMGVLKMLDEECAIPKLLDKLFMDKLASGWGEGQLDKFRLNKYRLGFIIHHYAGMVEYNVDNWLQKNTDPVNDHVLKLLPNLSHEFVRELVAGDEHLAEATQALPQKRGARVKTASFKHKEQLTLLMEQLELTEPLFVRCILPNLDKKPNKFDKKLVLLQLRCNGVLEGIRITRAGYPNRMTFDEFCARYSIINPKEVVTKLSRTNAEVILKHAQLHPDLFKVGITKIFFKNGILGKLEEMRDTTLKGIFTDLQLVIRGKLARRTMQRRIAEIQLAQVVARNMQRLDDTMKLLPWMSLFINIKPLLEESVKVLDSKEINESLKTVNGKLKDAEKLSKDLEVENDKLREQMTQLENEVITTTDLVKQKDAEVAKYKAADKRNLEALTKLEKKMEKLREVQKKLETDKAELEDQVEAMEKQQKKSQREHDELKAAHSEKERELVETKLKLDDHEKSRATHKLALEKLKESHAGELAALAAAHATKLAEAKGSVDKAAKTHLQDIQVLKLEMEDMKREQETLKKLQPKNAALTKEVNELQATLRKSKTDMTAKDREMALLRTLMVRNETDTSDIRNKLTQLEMELSQTRSRADTKAKELAKEQEASARAKKELSVVQAQVKQAERFGSELKQAHATLAQYKDDMRTLKEQAREASRERDSAVKALEKVKVEAETARRSKSEYTAKIVSLQSLVKQLEEELKQRELEKENEVPSQQMMDDFAAMKLKLNEALASLRLERFERTKVVEELKLVKTRAAQAEAAQTPTARRHFSDATTSSLSREVELLQQRLQQEEANSQRAEVYAIQLQKKLNKLQQLRGLDTSSNSDYERKFAESQARVTELEFQFERMVSNSADVSLLSINPLSKRNSVVTSALQQALPDFVAIYQDVTKTLKTTRDELSGAKLEILRLKSLLRELEDELYESKRLAFRLLTSDMETRLAELEVKAHRATAKNTELTELLELYQARAREYFDKLEMADAAVTASKRKEESATAELMEIRAAMRLAKEEARLTQILVKELRHKSSELEETVQDRSFQLEQCRLQIAELELKLLYFNNNYENKETQERFKDEIRELRHELKFKANSETTLIKELKQLQLDLEESHRCRRELETAAQALETEIARLETQVTELSNLKRELEGEKVLNTRKIGHLNKQVASLKEVVEEMGQQRDELLEVKDKLHVQISQLQDDLEARTASLKKCEQDNRLLKLYLEEKQLEHDEIRTELSQLRLVASADIADYQRLKREMLVTLEENDNLKKRNTNLTAQVSALEDKLYSNEQIRFWENKVKLLQTDLDTAQQEQHETAKLLKTSQREVKQLEIKLANETQNVKKYNDENFGYQNLVTQYKSTIDILHEEAADKDLAIKKAEREILELKEARLQLEQELLRSQQA